MGLESILKTVKYTILGALLAGNVQAAGNAAIQPAINLLLLTETCHDNDKDGYGNPASDSCTYPLLDCDDSNGAVNPAMKEGPVGDGTCSDTWDNDCNGLVDEDDAMCQSEGVDLHVKVKSSSSLAPIANALVSLSGADDYEALTGADGWAHFLGIDPGIYSALIQDEPVPGSIGQFYDRETTIDAQEDKVVGKYMLPNPTPVQPTVYEGLLPFARDVVRNVPEHFPFEYWNDPNLPENHKQNNRDKAELINTYAGTTIHTESPNPMPWIDEYTQAGWNIFKGSTNASSTQLGQGYVRMATTVLETEQSLREGVILNEWWNTFYNADDCEASGLPWERANHCDAGDMTVNEERLVTSTIAPVGDVRPSYSGLVEDAGATEAGKAFTKLDECLED